MLAAARARGRSALPSLLVALLTRLAALSTPVLTLLAAAILEWIEAGYNPRRHTSLGRLAPAEFEALHTTATAAA